MTTRTQQTTPNRWMLVFLAALVAVLATVFGAASASAAATPGAETRVRASQSVAHDIARPPEDIRAGQRLGNEPAGVVYAVATGVAADTVAMGRNMGQRVIPYAERNGYGYYAGTPKWVPRKTIARTTSPSTLENVDLWFNKRWINGQMRRGNRIIDIGEPPGYSPSRFYDMELDLVRGYRNYFQDFQP